MTIRLGLSQNRVWISLWIFQNDITTISKSTTMQVWGLWMKRTSWSKCQTVVDLREADTKLSTRFQSGGFTRLSVSCRQAATIDIVDSFPCSKVSSMMSHHSSLPRNNSPFPDFSVPSELHLHFSEWVKIEGKDQTFGWNAFLLQVIRENFQSAVGSEKSQKHPEWMFWHILELSWGNI